MARRGCSSSSFCVDRSADQLAYSNQNQAVNSSQLRRPAQALDLVFKSGIKNNGALICGFRRERICGRRVRPRYRTGSRLRATRRRYERLSAALESSELRLLDRTGSRLEGDSGCKLGWIGSHTHGHKFGAQRSRHEFS